MKRKKRNQLRWTEILSKFECWDLVKAHDGSVGIVRTLYRTSTNSKAGITCGIELLFEDRYKEFNQDNLKEMSSRKYFPFKIQKIGKTARTTIKRRIINEKF